jgi:osmoprotectant transport system permease protein
MDNFFLVHLPMLIIKLSEQIYLSGAAILIAIMISIPLGIWISKKSRLRNYLLAFASILQTIPSLAVLGCLLPLFGIGIKTAIVTLTLYSLLPILSNTVTGILNVPLTMREAADGLGFTKYQKMFLVEIP